MPNVSRYQFSASMYFGVCTTMCPSRCTLVGTRGGRCIALVRTFVWPKLNTCGVCAVGNASSRWVPDTTRTGSPLGSTRSTLTPPSDSGSGRTLVPVAPAAADQHTRRPRVAAPQVQLVVGAQHRGETKGVGKRFGLEQVRLLEL